jgi:thioredoxin 1
VKVNTDESKNLAKKHNVTSVPRLLFMKDGVIIDQIVGVVGKEAIQEKVDALNS